MDDDAGVLVRVFSPLRGDGVFLVDDRSPDVDVAVLEKRHCVAEDEVDGAVDVTVAVELALGVDVEGVLIALEAALEEDGEVGARPEGHGLVFVGPGRVLECHAPRNEPFSGDSCIYTYINCFFYL